MALFDNIFNKSEESQARLLLLTAIKSCEIILEEKQISKEAVFEVLLFNSLQILRIYKHRRPLNYSQFESQYFTALYEFTKEEGIFNKISGDYFDFVNNRFRLYSEQLSSMSDSDRKFIPSKIAYNFYENPLQQNSGNSKDLFLTMSLYIKLPRLIELLDNAIDLVLEDKFDIESDENNYFESESKLVLPGVGIDGIRINATTSSQIEKKYGNNYDLINHNNFSFEMYYADIGISCYYKQNDPTKRIFFIKLMKEFEAYTENGVILDLESEITVADIASLYGHKQNYLTSQGNDYAYLDYKGIMFYVDKEDTYSKPAEYIYINAIGII